MGFLVVSSFTFCWFLAVWAFSPFLLTMWSQEATHEAMYDDDRRPEMSSWRRFGMCFQNLKEIVRLQPLFICYHSKLSRSLSTSYEPRSLSPSMVVVKFVERTFPRSRIIIKFPRAGVAIRSNYARDSESTRIHRRENKRGSEKVPAVFHLSPQSLNRR